MGAGLVAGLTRAVKKRRIPMSLNSPFEELITGEDAAVIGAVIRGPTKLRCRAKKVILATGGFGEEKAMVAKYCPEIGSAHYFGSLGITGEGIEWGQRLGAAVCHMAAYNAYAIYLYPSGPPMSWTTAEKGAILINHQGQRFGNEMIGYSGFANEVSGQGDSVILLSLTRRSEIMWR